MAWKLVQFTHLFFSSCLSSLRALPWLLKEGRKRKKKKTMIQRKIPMKMKTRWKKKEKKSFRMVALPWASHRQPSSTGTVTGSPEALGGAVLYLPCPPLQPPWRPSYPSRPLAPVTSEVAETTASAWLRPVLTCPPFWMTLSQPPRPPPPQDQLRLRLLLLD